MSYSGIFAIQLSRLESRERSLSFDFNETVMVYIPKLVAFYTDFDVVVEFGDIERVFDV